jgi:DNA-directed RNA polymerase subunit RPC12/RpoP
MAAIECARCGSQVNEDAIRCPTCGGDPRTGEGGVDPIRHSPPALAHDVVNPTTMPCPACGQTVSTAAAACPHCGHPVASATQWQADGSPVIAAQEVAARRFPGAAVAIGACAAVSVIGAFLPWEAVGIFSIAGTRGDGVLTLGAGVIGLAVLLAVRMRRAFYTSELMCSAFVILIAGYHVKDATASTGIYVTLVAGIVWALSALVGAFRK